jgi:hypothetical protein
MSTITSFFQQSWNLFYKEKSIWLFVISVLILPIIGEIIPNQEGAAATSNLFGSIEAVTTPFIKIIDYIGVLFILNSFTAGKRIAIGDIFRVVKKSFGKVVAVSMLLLLIFMLLFVFPFGYVIAFSSPMQPSQVTPYIYFLSAFLATFIALFYFPIIETIINNSGILKSIKIAWEVFIKHPISLLFIGFINSSLFVIVTTLFGMTSLLLQNNFSWSSISIVDTFNPFLLFTDNTHALLRITYQIVLSILDMYAFSVFVLAYLHYSKIVVKKQYTA